MYYKLDEGPAMTNIDMLSVVRCSKTCLNKNKTRRSGSQSDTMPEVNVSR